MSMPRDPYTFASSVAYKHSLPVYLSFQQLSTQTTHRHKVSVSNADVYNCLSSGRREVCWSRSCENQMPMWD